MTDKSKVNSIARRYATALFGLLKESEAKDLADQCRSFLGACAQSPQVDAFLANPLIPWKKKTDVLMKCFPISGKTEPVKHFLELVCRKKREAMLPAFCDVFQTLVWDKQGQSQCHVTLAHDLPADTLKVIEKKISAKTKRTLVLDTKIDAGLIGGYIAEVDGVVFDASIRSQLEKMKQRLGAAFKV